MAGSGPLRQIGTFAAVGATATGVHFTAATLSNLVLPLGTANFIGFLFAFLVSYFGHMGLTFRVPSSERRHRQRLPKFVVTAVLGFAGSQCILLILESATQLPNWLILGVSIGFVPAFTYTCSRIWVFGRPG